MTTKTIIDFIIMSITFGSAFVMVGYEEFARTREWSVSRLAGGSALLKIIALATLLVALSVAFYAYRWWSPVVVLVLGFVYGFLSLLVLKQRVQAVAAVGTVAGLVLCLAYVE